MAEVGYYLSAADLAVMLDHACAALQEGGHLVAVHWRGSAPEHPLSADEVHRSIDALPALTRLGAWVEDDFLVEVFCR